MAVISRQWWSVEARRVPVDGLQVGIGAGVGGDEGGQGLDPGPARQHIPRAGVEGRPLRAHWYFHCVELVRELFRER